MPNLLIHEKSPYLLQHAHNPVSWRPWSKTAFELAASENKLIFLSIGYATCHWCHVMERESFEDPEAASYLNQDYICIKVDREERPDVDAVYMAACQMLTGAGGWPLSIFMTPDKRPFYAATYLPKTSRHGRPGLIDLCRAINTLWRQQPEKIFSSAQDISQHLQQSLSFAAGPEFSPAVFDMAYQQLAARYDERCGGFGQAPKFPSPHLPLFLLRYAQRYSQPQALSMVDQTLTAMRLGGIWDHVGFGFHRYATDQEWLVPHFEKMLYDQALMSIACLEAGLATGNAFHLKTADDTLAYVLRDMTAVEAAFYTAEDADSEGEEGKFYLWTSAEFHRRLSPDHASTWTKIWNLQPEGNFQDEATRQFTGANILHLRRPLAEYAAEAGLTVEALNEQWEALRGALFAERKLRPPPLKDDKVLTDWNGLMIGAMASGSRILAKSEYLTAADRAIEFILRQLTDDQGRLRHRYRDGDAGIAGTAGDYAFFIYGLLETYRAAYNPLRIQQALQFQEIMIQDFWDETAGGFYLSNHEASELPAKPKEVYDGAMPSVNSMSFFNLARLFKLTGDARFEDYAWRLYRAFAGTIAAHPTAFAYFLCGLDFLANPAVEAVVVGESGNAQFDAMRHRLNQTFLPGLTLLVKTSAVTDSLSAVAPFTADMKPMSGSAAAYICTNFICRQPVTTAEEMMNIINRI